MKIKSLIIGFFLLLTLAACEGTGTLATLTGGLVQRDAQTTLRWVDRELTAGRLAPADAMDARLCPDAVVALGRAIEDRRLRVGSDDEFRGLIYRGTLAKYMGRSQEILVTRAEQMFGKCITLIPTERVLRLLLR